MTGLLITCALLAAAVIVQSTRATRAEHAHRTERRRADAQAVALKEGERVTTALRSDLAAAHTLAFWRGAEADELASTLGLQIQATFAERDRARRAQGDRNLAFAEVARLRELLPAKHHPKVFTPEASAWDALFGHLGEATPTERPGLNLRQVLAPTEEPS